MPIQRCAKKGKRGWRWGRSGKCYPNKAKALQQMRAIKANGYTGNAFCPTGEGGGLTTNTRPVTNIKRRSVNPRRLDPTRTVAIRRRWQAEFKRRVAQLRRELRQLVAGEDAFGLGTNAPSPLVFHSFCPTGEGGGVDPTCSPSETGGAAYLGSVFKETRHINDVTYAGIDKAIEHMKATMDKPAVLKFYAEHGIDHTLADAQTKPKLLAFLRERVSRRLSSWERVQWDNPTMHSSVANTRFSFMSSPQKVDQFRVWLAMKIGATTMAKASKFAENYWWEQYVKEGYAKGAGRAFEDVNKAGALKEWAKGSDAPLDFYEGTKRDFLRSTFARPVAVEKVKLLAGRAYTDVVGVTDAMATKVTRALTDGLVQGWSPREVAKEMDGYLDAYENQALSVARTETIRAHAEGTLDALEQLGVDEVGVMVEWSTSGLGVTGLGNPSPCEVCAEMEGVVLTIEEMRGMIPRHPNCMCSPIPANVGEDQEGQTRGQSSIERAILDSVRAEGKTPESSSWLGSDADIARMRPENLV